MTIARSAATRLAHAFPPFRRLLENYAVLERERQELQEVVAQRNAKIVKLNYRVANLKEKLAKLEAENASLRAERERPAPAAMPNPFDLPLLDELSVLGRVVTAFESERDQLAAELDRLRSEKHREVGVKVSVP